eukprot:3612404-Prymnesium_polylepis.1
MRRPCRPLNGRGIPSRSPPRAVCPYCPCRCLASVKQYISLTFVKTTDMSKDAPPAPAPTCEDVDEDDNDASEMEADSE